MLKDPTAFKEQFNKWKSGLLVYDKGKPITDELYITIMERVASENNERWNRLRRLEGGRELSVDEDLLRILNDNDYDYRGYYNKYPNGKANALTHWTDEFKTAYHPTFSVYSKYSGKKSQYNPHGVLGGLWLNGKYVPAWGQKLQKTDSKLQTFNEGKEQEKSMFHYINRAVRYIAQHEGFVDHVYEDKFASQDYAKKNGYWSDKYLKYVLPTAGYGWTAKKDLKHWTKEEADARLREDVIKYDDYWRKKIPGWDSMKDEHKIAIIDLGHLGGLGVLDKMPKFKAALMRGDKDAGNYLSFASHQTKNRNDDRIALWNSPEKYRLKEFNQISKQIAKEKAAHVEPVDFAKYKKQILPIDRNFDLGVPESISLQNTFDTPAQKAVKTLNSQVTLNKIIKELALEELNPWSSAPQIEDIMAGQVFNKMLTMPQIIGQ